MPSAKPSLDLLRSLTDEHVVRTLMAHRRLTRAEIAGLTGISKPTISEAVRRLAAAGTVVATGEQSAGRGRAGDYYTLTPECGVALAVSIAPVGVVAELVDVFGAVIASAEVGLDRDPGEGAVVAALGEAVASLTAPGAGRRRLRAAVVSAADPVDRDTGRLVQLPDAPFLVGELDPREVLSGLVEGPVVVDNDVNWAARAERDAEEGGSHDFVYLYLDEGLGCAVVSDGDVRRGHAGLAGEIAHLVTTGPDGRATRLTDVFAALGLRRAGSTAIDVDRVVAQLHGAGGRDDGGDGGDGGAGGAGAAETLRALAAAVGGVVDAVVALADPEVVVVGGAWGSDAAFLAALRDRSQGRARAVTVTAAALRERPDLLGARAAALTELRGAVVGDTARHASSPQT